jgi:hypothetical protein
MAAPFRDLSPREDVKGGSPRTPSGGIPRQEYDQYVATNENGTGVWKAIAGGVASGAFGMIVGLFLAWYTAMQGKGVTQKELQEYEDKFSPYVQERSLLAEHNRFQDTQIGELRGVQQSNVERLNEFNTKFHDDERDFTEFKTATEKNNKYVADFIEELRKAKK